METGNGDPALSQEARRPQERIPREVVNNVLAAIGNSEAKALALLLMQPGSVYTSSDVANGLIAKQHQGQGWPISPGTTKDYFRLTFEPIGLVATEITGNWRSVGYQKTPLGESLGDGVAGLMLEFSERHSEYGLIQLIGATNSTAKTESVDIGGEEIEYKKRSVDRLRQIYFELLTTPHNTITVSQLFKALGTDNNSVNNHIKNLKDSGIINYEGRGYGEAWLTYQFQEGQTPEGRTIPHDESSGRYRAVYDFFKSNSGTHISADEVLEALKVKFPGDDPGKLLYDIYAYCAELEGLGVLRDTSKFTRELGSRISLKPEAYDTVYELVDLLERIQDADPETLAQGQRFGKEILADPNRVTKLMEKARRLSPGANKTSRSEVSVVITGIVSQNPGARTADIVSKLRDLGYNFTLPTVTQYMKRMKDEGMVTSAPYKGKQNLWYIDDGSDVN